MRRVSFVLGFAVVVIGCKSRASDQVTADAGSMPLNVRAELQALCEAAAGTADPDQRAACRSSEAPRDGASEEVMLRLRDDEAGVFLYYAKRSAFAEVTAHDASSSSAGATCPKMRVVWRFENAKVPTAMVAPATNAANAACDKGPLIP